MVRSSSIALVIALAAACSSTTTREAAVVRDASVSGWFLAGPRMQSFRIGLDRDVCFAGAASGRLESSESGSGAATMMQSITADAYRGKRIRFSAVVRTRDVEGWTGLWMRVDRAEGRSAFDNMQQRPLRGTSEWTRVEVVLDVAQDATAVQFGLLQDGRGTSWIDEATLEPVNEDVAITAIEPQPRALANAGFEAAEEAGRARAPSGWMLHGFAHEDFTASSDHAEKHGGSASAKLESTIDTPRGYAALTQSVRPDDYAGTRVRVSAWIKSRGVERGGSFDIRTLAVGASPTSRSLTYASCPLADTSDWHLCEGVLDIPTVTGSLELGLALQSKGAAWMDDVRIEPVGLDVAPTGVDDRPRAFRNGDFEKSNKTVDAWIMSGGGRAHYEAVVDVTEKRGGKQSARLAPRVKDPQGYGTMMQTFRAHDFRGKRLRMNAFVKGKGIDGRGDLWLRVQAAESPGDGPGLGGGRCSLSGTFDWKPCTLVFDVPSQGDAVDVGVGLDAHGTVWLDDVTFEEVDASVPLSASARMQRDKLEDGGFERAEGMPGGWFLSGNARKEVAVAVDRDVHAEGTASVRLTPTVEKPSGYGTLMTSILAERYRGKRLRMSAQVRGRGITGRGDMWLRVQALTSPGDGPGLGGGSCPLAGDFEWRPCTMVFDVPERGMWIETGIGLAGPGTIWLDDMKLEEVEKTAKVTSVVRERNAPENLGFER